MTVSTQRIDLAHGAGGRATAALIADVFTPAFRNSALMQGDDGAVLPMPSDGWRLVFSTDGHVVSPLIFPGGDIGHLAVCGTVNDLAMMGARPLYLSVGFILEEGVEIDLLRRIARSMAEVCETAGVRIVTGDTKVVEKGKADGVFITTAGVGALPPGRHPSGASARPGDAVLLTGTLGDHGMAVLNARENLAFEADIRSDVAPLNGLIETLFQAVDPGDIHVLRDPTRGGLAATLNEIAAQSGVGITVTERNLPVTAQVRAMAELLGVDPLHLANEGKAVVICAAAAADAALRALTNHPMGCRAARIGTVIADDHRFVRVETEVGGQRLLDWLTGDPLPRIC